MELYSLISLPLCTLSPYTRSSVVLSFRMRYRVLSSAGSISPLHEPAVDAPMVSAARPVPLHLSPSPWKVKSPLSLTSENSVSHSLQHLFSPVSHTIFKFCGAAKSLCVINFYTKMADQSSCSISAWQIPHHNRHT